MTLYTGHDAMLELRYDTPDEWTHVVLGNLDAFLQDHAANERKVAISALTLAAQHPRRRELVTAMIAVAQEELSHFGQVHELLGARGATLGQDGPDPYMSALHRAVRRPEVNAYLLDRLVLFAVVEARGCERFTLLSRSLSEPALADFYTELVRSEARHHAIYLKLAYTYFDRLAVYDRLDALLDLEAEVARARPLRPALH